MQDYSFDLQNPTCAYIFGFIQADGHMGKRANRKSTTTLSIELSRRDKDILTKIKECLPVTSSLSHREKSTNYTDVITAFSTLKINSQKFRNTLNTLGVPIGEKSKIVTVPKVAYCKIDFWRGMIDGDGSLGLTKDRFPFISLATSSDNIAHEYKLFVKSYIGRYVGTNRNSRDGSYNIVLYKEDAQKLISALYYDGCLCLDRKKGKAKLALSWGRPSGMKRVIQKSWTANQDSFILTNTIKKSAKRLGRTEQGIKMRLWRLKNVV